MMLHPKTPDDILPDENHSFPVNPVGCNSATTSYISGGKICVCELGWGGELCQRAYPAVPILLQILQILYSFATVILVVLTLAMLIVALKQKGNRRSFTAYICASFLLGLLVRIVWLIEPYSVNPYTARISQFWADFSFWSGYALWLFGYCLSLGLWCVSPSYHITHKIRAKYSRVEFLTKKIKLIKVKKARKISLGVAISWLIIVAALIIATHKYSVALYALWAVGMITQIAIIVLAFIVSWLVFVRLREIRRELKEYTRSHWQAERLARWAACICVVFTTFLILLVVYVARYEHQTQQELVIYMLIMRLLDVAIVYCALQLNARRGLLDELTRCIRLMTSTDSEKANLTTPDRTSTNTAAGSQQHLSDSRV